MEWQDKAILLRKSQLGENKFILTLFVSTKGIIKSVIRNTKKNTQALQVGNILEISWKGRLDEHLGNVTIINCNNIYPYVIDDNIRLHMIISCCNMLHDLIFEKDPHVELFKSACFFLKNITDGNYLFLYISFELKLLSDLGFGLNLEECGVSKSKKNLSYISPKTGRAISNIVGAPYKTKLFIMPQSLKKNTKDIRDILYSFEILRYFIKKNLYSLRECEINSYRIKLEKLIRDLI